MSLGRHRSQLKTPALCLDLDWIEQRAETLAAHVHTGHQRWWLSGCEVDAFPLVQHLAELGVSGISVCGVDLLLSAATQLRTSFRLSQIAASPDDLRQLSRLPSDCAPLFPCDHYAQGEMLSDVGISLGRQWPVLLEVNLGLNRTGIRPGVDAKQLIQGLATLPGIDIAGITGSLGIIDGTVDARWLNARVRLLTDLLSELPPNNGTPPQVHVMAEGDLTLLTQHPEVTDIVSGSLLGSSTPTANDSPLCVIASVISRSKLERAVLDAGYLHTGGDSRRLTVPVTAHGRALPDIESIDVASDTMTLALGPESLDLVIGDRVEVRLPDPQLTWRLYSTIYGIRKGVVEAVWRRAS